MDGSMIAQNQTYTGIQISLDGNSFQDCIFEKCHLVISGILPFTLHKCKFNECTWRFAGPAESTFRTLASLYQLPGMASALEATFEHIRGKTPRGPSLLKH
jgi:hypothetical protein